MVERASKQGLPCPVCKVDLVMSERQGIEIDYCPQCRGVWLDRGELDKIIERGAAETAPPPPTPSRGGYDRGHDSHRGDYGYGDHKRRRRKSFFEELFD